MAKRKSVESDRRAAARDALAGMGAVNYGGPKCEYCNPPRLEIVEDVLGGAADHSANGGMVTWQGIWEVLLAHLAKDGIAPPSTKRSSLEYCVRHHRGSFVDQLNMPRSPRRV